MKCITDLAVGSSELLHIDAAVLQSKGFGLASPFDWEEIGESPLRPQKKTVAGQMLHLHPFLFEMNHCFKAQAYIFWPITVFDKSINLFYTLKIHKKLKGYLFFF